MESKSKLPESKSPLLIAIKKAIHENNSEIVHAALLNKSIKKAINVVDPNGITPLIEARDIVKSCV